jgi:hypothetical protein
MPEAPLEALARLQSKLEDLRKRQEPAKRADLEDAVNVAQDLIHLLGMAGVPIYSEKDLLRFVYHHFRASEHSLSVARERLAKALERSVDLWAVEASGYALALASFKNWELSIAEDAFVGLDARRQAVTAILALDWPGGPFVKAQQGASREMGRAFLDCTEPSAIAQWLNDNPEEKS